MGVKTDIGLAAFFLILVTIGAVKAPPFYDFISEPCYTETVVLLDQWLADVPGNPEAGVIGCHQCLHIRVMRPDSSMTLTYYFPYEYQTHPEWQKGDVLVITWCETPAGWRIRKVEKVGSSSGLDSS